MNIETMNALHDIRVAAGDKYGKLMHGGLVARIARMRDIVAAVDHLLGEGGADRLNEFTGWMHEEDVDKMGDAYHLMCEDDTNQYPPE